VVMVSKNVEGNSFASISVFSNFTRIVNSNFIMISSVEVIIVIRIPISVDRFNMMLSRVSITYYSFKFITVVSSLSNMSSSNLLGVGSIEVVMMAFMPVS